MWAVCQIAKLKVIWITKLLTWSRLTQTNSRTAADERHYIVPAQVFVFTPFMYLSLLKQPLVTHGLRKSTAYSSKWNVFVQSLLYFLREEEMPLMYQALNMRHSAIFNDEMIRGDTSERCDMNESDILLISISFLVFYLSPCLSLWLFSLWRYMFLSVFSFKHKKPIDVIKLFEIYVLYHFILLFCSFYLLSFVVVRVCSICVQLFLIKLHFGGIVFLWCLQNAVDSSPMSWIGFAWLWIQTSVEAKFIDKCVWSPQLDRKACEIRSFDLNQTFQNKDLHQASALNFWSTLTRKAVRTELTALSK